LVGAGGEGVATFRFLTLARWNFGAVPTKIRRASGDPMPVLVQDTKHARAGNVIGLFRRFCALSSGHRVHECIKAPKDLSFPVDKRSKRLIHDSQISLW
jgi:hypothetical protein